MERFELTIVAQGPHSIWIALLVVALLCMMGLTMFLFFCATRRPLVQRDWNPEHQGGKHPRFSRRV